MSLKIHTENNSMSSQTTSGQADLLKLIQKFKDNAVKLQEIYDSDIAYLKKVSEILRQDALASDKEDDLLSQLDINEINRAMEQLRSRNPTNLRAAENEHEVAHNPCIAIVGQTKSGKSTFINTLLEQYIVPQDIQKCTARITHLTFSEQNYVQLRHPSKGVIANTRRNLDHSYLPDELPAMTDQDRDDEAASKLIVEAGIKSDFLKNGVDVLDSPGLNENTCLDELVKNMVASVMPFIIYVIDGKKTVTESDITDIRTIKEACPSLEILYFVTKLDTQHQGRRVKNEQTEAIRRMTLVFEKLKRNGFLPKDEDMETSQIFHGASLWKVDDYRSGKLKDNDNMHVKGFDRMKACLTNMVACYLDSTIKNVAFTFQHFNECVLEKIIKRASSIYYDTQKKLKEIQNIKEEEKQIFANVIEFLAGSEGKLKQKLIQLLTDNQERLLQPLEDHVYPTKFRIDESGEVSDKELIKKCQKSISRAVVVALDTEMKEFVQSEMLKVYSRAEEYLSKHIENMSNATTSKTSFRDMLENILLTIYDLNSTNSKHQVRQSSLMEVINTAVSVVKSVFLAIFGIQTKIPKLNVHDKEWKKKQAQYFLTKLHQEDFASKVCNTLRADMNKKHDKFNEAMIKETQDVTAHVRISEESRKKLVEMSPDFALLFMKSLAIKSLFEYENMKAERKIGEGAQGQVYLYSQNGQQFAVKMASINSDNLGEIAMEIYFSSTFHHHRLLPLKGVLLVDTEESEYKRVSMIMPMMKYDATHLLKKYKPPLLKRLKLAYQVCEALVYLHEEGIMHRDLKLANILIDNEDNAVVADYGFVKKEALAMGSFVGTPVHIAPEIVRGEKNYDLSVDVYSFGVLIWYFAEGTGRHPKYTRTCTSVAAVLVAATDDGARPERHDFISEPLWKLMTDCWLQEPSQRPTIQKVLVRFEKILQEME